MSDEIPGEQSNGGRQENGLGPKHRERRDLCPRSSPCSRGGLTVAEVENWKERYLTAAENALRSRPKGRRRRRGLSRS